MMSRKAIIPKVRAIWFAFIMVLLAVFLCSDSAFNTVYAGGGSLDKCQECTKDEDCADPYDCFLFTDGSQRCAESVGDECEVEQDDGGGCFILSLKGSVE